MLNAKTVDESHGSLSVTEYQRNCSCLVITSCNYCTELTWAYLLCLCGFLLAL